MNTSDEIPNIHSVPKKQWQKWSDNARRTFNSMFSWWMANQSIAKHPDAPEIEPKHWSTIAWNAAWVGADHANGKVWWDHEKNATNATIIPQPPAPQPEEPPLLPRQPE